MLQVNQPLLDGREKELLIECIESGWISSDGPNVKKFEDGFAQFIGVKHGVAVANGTAALEAALFAIDLKEGDEVIMPSFTIISCAIAALRFGAKPVLVDIEPVTWNIDVDLIESKITPRTKAIMAVHMYGHPCDLDPILALAKRYNLKVVEDASQVHGALYKGTPCGAIGHISTFSFYANKILTTGEGGMVMTSDDHLADRARSYRNLCMRSERRFYHTEIGNNLRMTNMQAALGVAQLERVDEFVEFKRVNGARYCELLNQIPGVKTQLEMPWAKMVYWMYCVELSESTGWDAEKMMAELSIRGVGTRPFFLGLHEQPVLRDKGWYLNEAYPVTHKSSRQGFYLPSSVNLTQMQIEFVVDQIDDILRK
jgi:perosamine synthetase